MIPLHPQSRVAMAIISRLCEGHARQEETPIAEILRVAGTDEKMAWSVLAELVRAELVTEGFDVGGYLITREPASITLLEVVSPFEPLLQNEGARITRAMRPMVLDYFRSITFSACASSCPSDSVGDEPGDCPRSVLDAWNNSNTSSS
ncbi:MAG: hypothetical protein KatS3mg104_0607 [Phycisphaerae bacterium]|nr:MAG: hypothetical protein KatS3mg104_0607 [Phycisphaerae bacterium]